MRRFGCKRMDSGTCSLDLRNQRTPFLLRKTVPIFVPTPRIEALPAIARPGAPKARKPLKTRDT